VYCFVSATARARSTTSTGTFFAPLTTSVPAPLRDGFKRPPFIARKARKSSSGRRMRASTPVMSSSTGAASAFLSSIAIFSIATPYSGDAATSLGTTSSACFS